MKKLTRYRLIVYGGALIISGGVSGIALFIHPGFAFIDLCGPMVRDIDFSDRLWLNFFKGELYPNPMYNQENSEELINACYTAQNISKVGMFPIGFLIGLLFLKSLILKPEEWGVKRSAI